MRLIRMSERSRYRGLECMYCNRKITNGRVALASTFYVSPTKWRTYAGWKASEQDPTKVLVNPVMAAHRQWKMFPPLEIQVRIVYHRRCIEKVLSRGPYDVREEASMFDRYREGLKERFEERKPGSVRYPRSDDAEEEMRALPYFGWDSPED